MPARSGIRLTTAVKLLCVASVEAVIGRYPDSGLVSFPSTFHDTCSPSITGSDRTFAIRLAYLTGNSIPRRFSRAGFVYKALVLRTQPEVSFHLEFVVTDRP